VFGSGNGKTSRSGFVYQFAVPQRPKGPARRFVIPKDFLQAIRVNPKVRENFRTFSPAYVRIRIAYIERVRGRPAEFRQCLRHFPEMTQKNKLVGFGGIEKYYGRLSNFPSAGIMYHPWGEFRRRTEDGMIPETKVQIRGSLPR
jgi:hypothetical protein